MTIKYAIEKKKAIIWAAPGFAKETSYSSEFSAKGAPSASAVSPPPNLTDLSRDVNTYFRFRSVSAKNTATFNFLLLALIYRPRWTHAGSARLWRVPLESVRESCLNSCPRVLLLFGCHPNKKLRSPCEAAPDCGRRNASAIELGVE